MFGVPFVLKGYVYVEYAENIHKKDFIDAAECEIDYQLDTKQAEQVRDRLTDAICETYNSVPWREAEEKINCKNIWMDLTEFEVIRE